MSSFCTAKATHIFFSKKFQHICVSLDVNFNESLTNDVVSFEQLGPDHQKYNLISCFLSVCIIVLLKYLELHQQIRVRFRESKIRLSTPTSYPSDRSKAVPLLQFFSVRR